MRVTELVKKAVDSGVFLYAKNGNLGFKLSVPVFPEELKSEILANKADIIALLSEAEGVEATGNVTLRKRGLTKAHLSQAQKRLWFIDHFQQGSAEYNMPRAIRLTGGFDIDAAQRAITRIIQRHEILRTHYEQQDGELQQIVKTEFNFGITRFDLSDKEKDEREVALKSLIQTYGRTPFDLSRDLMVRAAHVALNKTSGQEESVLLFTLHHIACDGWSMQLLLKEFNQQYEAIKQGQVDPLPPLTIQYSDFASWQHEFIQSGGLEKQLNYWQEQLHEVPTLHHLPLDKPRPEQKQQGGQFIRGQLSGDTAKQLMDVARRYDLTPFMLLHGCLALVLSRYANHQDIVMGTPVANRTQAELEPLIGFFINTLVLRVNTQETDLKAYFAQVRKVNLDAQANQDVPFEQILESLKVPRSVSHAPLVQVMLNMRTSYGGEAEKQGSHLGGLATEQLSANQTDAKLDLSIIAQFNSQGISVDWIFDEALFDEIKIQQLNAHLLNVLNRLSQKKAQSVTELLALPDEQLSLITTLQHGPKIPEAKTTLVASFEEYARQNPHVNAVHFNEQSYSYGVLADRVNQLAGYLLENTQDDDKVALLLNRGLDMVATQLACLKIGLPYIPIDPANPKGRINAIVNDSKPAFLITQTTLAESQVATEMLLLDNAETAAELARYKDQTPTLSLQHNGNRTAYIIYTSGSTGKPKGVMVSQANLAHFRDAFNLQLEHFSLRDGSGWLSNASYAFDAAIKSLVTLSQGHPLILPTYEQSKSPQAIVALIKEHQVEVFNGPPLFMDYILDELQSQNCPVHLIVSGDKVSEQQWQSLRDYSQKANRIAVNAYGPTEATVNISYSVIGKQHQVTIGKPMANSAILVLDEQRQPLPAGAIGELYLGGAGIAKGYLGQPELSDEHFVLLQGQRFYRSGDLGRYTSDGEIQFIGRTDDQVKVRGFRIELEEISCILASFDGVTQAITLVAGSGIEQRLQAFYVGEADDAALDAYIRAELPEYMIPQEYFNLAELPLTSGGKVDKQALLKLASAKPASSSSTNTGGSVRQHLQQIWQGILNHSSVNDEDEFFKLGGHSLLAMKLLADISQRFAIRLEIKELFSHLSFVSQVELITERLTAEDRLAEFSESSNITSAATGEASTGQISERITAIWRDILKKDDIQPSDNFFALGGHSLLAMKLLADIDREFGHRFVIKDLFKLLTLESQVAALTEITQSKPSQKAQEKPQENNKSCLLKLNRSLSKRNIFCFHPRLGSSLVYRTMASKLSALGTFYGIEPAQLVTDVEFDSISELAALYVSEITRLQPKGAYHLLGYSIGGRLAYEVATQLKAAGKEVAMTAILDTRPYLENKGRAKDEAWYEPIKMSLETYANVSYPKWENLAVYDKEQGIEHILSDFADAEIDVQGLNTEDLRRFMHYYCDFDGLGLDYVSSQSDLDLLFIKSNTQNDLSQYSDWERFTNGAIQLHTVDCDHANMLNGGNLETICQQIKNYLKGVQA